MLGSDGIVIFSLQDEWLHYLSMLTRGYDKEHNGGLSQEKFTPCNLVKLPPLFNSPATISFSSPCFLLSFVCLTGFSAFSFTFSALVISFSLDFLTVSRNTLKKKKAFIPHESMKGRQSPYSNSNITMC